MFWSSVVGSLETLRHWEFWIAIALCAALVLAYQHFAASAFGERPGCLPMLLGAVYQCGLLSLVIGYLLPILLGGPDATPIPVLVRHTGSLIMAVVAATVVMVLLSLIPVVGSLVGYPPISAFIQATTIFRVLMESEPLVAAAGFTGSLAGVVEYPGFFPCIGYLAVAGIVSLLTAIAGGVALDKAGVDPEGEGGGSGPFGQLVSAFGTLVAFAPLLMYAAYVRNSPGLTTPVDASQALSGAYSASVLANRWTSSQRYSIELPSTWIAVTREDVADKPLEWFSLKLVPWADRLEAQALRDAIMGGGIDFFFRLAAETEGGLPVSSLTITSSHGIMPAHEDLEGICRSVAESLAPETLRQIEIYDCGFRAIGGRRTFCVTTDGILEGTLSASYVLERFPDTLLMVTATVEHDASDAFLSELDDIVASIEFEP